VSTFVQVLPSVVAVVVALITGFGAAALKHKWDVAADETRWRQESSARLRAQRLDAFGRYLTARPDLKVVRSLVDSPGDVTAVLSGIRLAAANLLILLPEAVQRTVVEDDLHTVENWVAAWLGPSQRGERADIPSAEAILDLARALVSE
jgi:hypothetical protein